MSKSLPKLISLSLMGVTLLTQASFSEVMGRSMAIINGEAIYLSEFESNWEALMEQRDRSNPSDEPTADWKKKNKKLLLDQMIEEKILLQEAKRRNIVVPKRQLEEGVLQVKNRFKILPPGAKPTKEDYERELTPKEKTEFLKELESQQITEKTFASKIEDQLKVLRLTEEEVRGNVMLPFKDNGQKPGEKEDENRELIPEYEKEAKTLFTSIETRFNQTDFKPKQDDELDQITAALKSNLGESVHARHILIKSSRTDDMKKRSTALNKAKDIKKQLEKGADFIDLAEKNSDGPSAKTGGDLGFFTRGQMVPEIDKVAFALPVGGISDVIETEFGYHILQVEEKKAARRLRFEDVKMDLAGYVYQKRMKDRYDQFIAELRKKADVKILIDLDKETKG